MIFCNNLMHHLVFKKLSHTKRGQERFLKNVKKIFKRGGTVCITECTIESYIGDWSNNLHFILMSISLPFLLKIFRTFGAKSAEAGVYFRSEKGWKELFENCGFRVVKQTKELDKANFLGWKQKIAKAALFIRDHLCHVGYELICDDMMLD